MGMEFSFWSSCRLLLAEVNGTPSEAEVDASRAEGANLATMGLIDAMILDLRNQVGSNLTAQKARAILVQCDRHLNELEDAPQVLPIAIITNPGSIGQGIGRMFIGHAYGLDRLRVELFESEDAAAEWLKIPADWRNAADRVNVSAS